ncbi:MAG: NrfD/PsrC family molybdoenzyme membrane anchor subunit [Gaiellaceae bacterium]
MSVTEVSGEMRSYYGRPVIKEPVWQPEIPWYFFTGGLAGGSSVLSLVARMAGNETLARRSLYVAAAADIVSPVLLISDLGRPERFLNMFRVFKVTSPMSVGSWILAYSSAASSVSAFLHTIGRLRGVADLARTASAVSGAPLAVYTATLISDTAIPVWHEARRELPFVFGSSAVASAGAAAAIAVPPAQAGPARRLAVGGVLVENALFKLMEKRLGMIGEPYSKGEAGKYKQVALGCTLGGAALLAGLGRRSRLASAAGGALVLAGEVAARWSVFKAGFQSARDPKYTVEPQRERAQSRTAPGSAEGSV